MTDEQKAKSAFVIDHLYPVAHAIDVNVFDLEYIIEDAGDGSEPKESVIINRFDCNTVKVDVTRESLFDITTKVIKQLNGKEKAAAKLALRRR